MTKLNEMQRKLTEMQAREISLLHDLGRLTKSMHICERDLREVEDDIRLMEHAIVVERGKEVEK